MRRLCASEGLVTLGAIGKKVDKHTLAKRIPHHAIDSSKESP